MLDLLFGWRSTGLLEVIFTFFSYAMVILLALPVHEMAHAYAADRMGDQTARWNGRLTLNPFAHLDIFGTLLIFLFRFGYAKPVPVNPRNFKDYRKGIIITSVAGPLSNLAMSLISLIILRVLIFISPTYLFAQLASVLFYNFAYINIILAVFNLMPIPPLDGYRIISNFLPPRWTYFIERYQWYITIGFFLLVVSNRFGGLLTFIAAPIYRLFLLIVGL
jgi:Zn-dependent protease